MNVDQLLELSDDLFRDLVNRELRKDSPAVLAGDPEEKAYLDSLSHLLRDPAILPRWVTVLKVMENSSQTQLGARRADKKKSFGIVSQEDYAELCRIYEKEKASTLRFLHRVQARLIETKLYASQPPDPSLAQELIRQIENHRDRTLAEYDDPSDADEDLWDLIPQTAAFRAA